MRQCKCLVEEKVETLDSSVGPTKKYTISPKRDDISEYKLGTRSRRMKMKREESAAQPVDDSKVI